MKNIHAIINKSPLKKRTRLTDNETITIFQAVQKQETWESVSTSKEPNCMLD
jgi:hypothetical protein